MNNADRLRKKRQKVTEYREQLQTQLKETSAEMKRVAMVLNKAGDIITDIDLQFEKATQLSQKDIAFLFGATALQCVRWILQPKLDLDYRKTHGENRWTAAEGAGIEKAEQELYFMKHSETWKHNASMKAFYTWDEIIMAPVPYDAMEGTEFLNIVGVTECGKRISGINHHTATLGHDPVFGWLFGTLNILTRTVTFSTPTLETHAVSHVLGTNQQSVKEQIPITIMLSQSFQSVQEDSKRLFAAVAKQAMHQESDKYTKMGLQIPFVTPETAQMLLRKGWNSAEVEKMAEKTFKNIAVIGTQYLLSTLIDQIIAALHLLCYDGLEDLDIYKVKTQRILQYSNIMSSSGNLIYSIVTEQYDGIDVGGILKTLALLFSSQKFIRQVKQEFIEKRWNEIVMGECENE